MQSALLSQASQLTSTRMVNSSLLVLAHACSCHRPETTELVDVGARQPGFDEDLVGVLSRLRRRGGIRRHGLAETRRRCRLDPTSDLRTPAAGLLVWVLV